MQLLCLLKGWLSLLNIYINLMCSYWNSLKFSEINTPVWTSGSNNGGEKRFYWISTGDKVDYKNWRRGQPDGMDRGDKLGTDHCLQVSPEDGYDWNDSTCFTKLYFICEKDV